MKVSSARVPALRAPIIMTCGSLRFVCLYLKTDQRNVLLLILQTLSNAY